MPDVVTLAPRLVVPLIDRFVTPVIVPPNTVLPVIVSEFPPPVTPGAIVTVVAVIAALAASAAPPAALIATVPTPLARIAPPMVTRSEPPAKVSMLKDWLTAPVVTACRLMPPAPIVI